MSGSRSLRGAPSVPVHVIGDPAAGQRPGWSSPTRTRRHCSSVVRTRWSGRSWIPAERWPWLPRAWWTAGSDRRRSAADRRCGCRIAEFRGWSECGHPCGRRGLPVRARGCHRGTRGPRVAWTPGAPQRDPRGATRADPGPPSPWTDQLVSPAGLQVVSVESGPRRPRWGAADWGEPVTVGPCSGRLAPGRRAAGLRPAGHGPGHGARPGRCPSGAGDDGRGRRKPGVRRRFAMWAAIVVAAVGSALGALAGIAPAWAALRSADVLADPAQCLWSPVRPGAGRRRRGTSEGMVYCDVPLAIPLDVPWTWLAVWWWGSRGRWPDVPRVHPVASGCSPGAERGLAAGERRPAARLRFGRSVAAAHDDVPMGHLDISRVTFALPDGRVLLDEVSFKVAEGKVTALVGANGSGKSTLMRMIAGDEPTQSGAITRVGSLGVMRQFVGHMADGHPARPAAGRGAADSGCGRGGARRGRAGDDGRRRRGHADALRARDRGVGRGRRLRPRGRLGRGGRLRAGRPLRPGAVPGAGHAVGRGAEADRPRGAVPRSG